MVELDSMIEQTTPVEVDFNGFKIACEVRLNGVTSDFYDSVKGSDNSGHQLLVRSIVSWDIAVKGQVIPVSLENLKKLPLPLIEELGDAIIAKRAELKKKNSEPSSATSSQAVG